MSAGSSGLEALLTAVYADPHDEAARSAYANALTSAGDPRGEFIALQTARHAGRKLTRDEKAREKALLERHCDAWMGPTLASVATKKSVRFERGFLVAWGEKPNGVKDPGTVGGCPELATVEELECSAGEVIFSPHMKSLRSLHTGPLVGISVLTADPPLARLETLRIGFATAFGPDEDAAVGVAPGAPALQNLRFGNVRDGGRDLLRWRDTPLGRRLHSLGAGTFTLTRSVSEGALDHLDVRVTAPAQRRWPEVIPVVVTLSAAPTRSVALVSEGPLDPVLVSELRRALPDGVSLTERVEPG